MPRSLILLLVLAAGVCPISSASDRDPADAEASPPSAISPMIGWLLDRNRELNGIEFREVILAITGKKVLAFDSNSEGDQRVAKLLSVALDAATKQLNAPGSAVQNVPRINEVSSPQPQPQTPYGKATAPQAHRLFQHQFVRRR